MKITADIHCDIVARAADKHTAAYDAVRHTDERCGTFSEYIIEETVERCLRVLRARDYESDDPGDKEVRLCIAAIKRYFEVDFPRV